MLTDDLPLFAWRPAVEPTPTPERFKRAKGDPRDYRAEFLALMESRPDVAERLMWEALVELRAGATRIEVNALFSRVRAALSVTLNNSYRAAAADHLAAMDPRLDALIERRRRKVTK